MDTGSHGDNIATELSEFLYWGLLDIKQVNELLDPNIVYTSQMLQFLSTSLPIAETKSITVIVSGKNLRRTNIFQILIGEELYSKCIQELSLIQYPDSKSLVFDMLSYPECIVSIKNSGVSCPAIVLQRPSATKQKTDRKTMARCGI